MGTLISRVTGLLRLSVLSWALGISTLSDIFNLANNAPNTFFDLLIGGVLASTLVPVMVKASSRVARDQAAEDLSALITVMTGALLIATLVFELISGPIISAYLIGNHTPTKQIQVRAAVNLLRFFAPQLFFYGIVSLLTSLLNTKRHFAIPAYAPIINNFFAIVTFVVFRISFSHVSSSQEIIALSHSSPELWLLGLGTTFGVVFQGLVIVYAIRKKDFGLRINFDLFNPAVREVLNLSGWTFGYVLANQISLFFILALADAHSPGSVSSYNNSYLFFQLPYGIAAYSVMAAIIPDLAENITHGELSGFKRSLARGLRISVSLLIPATAIYVSMSTPIVALLLGHGAASAHGLKLTASSLVALALGLPGFGLFLGCIQALQSARLAKSVFYVYLFENTVNIVLALGLVAKFGVFGLSLSVSIAYFFAAIMAYFTLAHYELAPRAKTIMLSWLKISVPSLIMGIVVWYLVKRLGTPHGVSLVIDVILELVTAAVSFGGVTLLIYISATLFTSRSSK